MNSTKILTWVQVFYWLLIIGILVWAYMDDPLTKAAMYRELAIWSQNLARKFGTVGLWAEHNYYLEIGA